MKRIKDLFGKKNQNILNVYCTAGFPELKSTVEVMKSLQENGADIIELGIPYSDPLADGPVIQASSLAALGNGMTLKELFSQLQGFREKIQIPVILMGYMNTVLQYGFEKFCADAAAIGIDGLILPDLPMLEFDNHYGGIVRKYGLDFIFLVTPETSRERVLELDKRSSGFLYAVSSSSTTGSEKNMEHVENYLKRLSGYNLSNPVLVGFGIKDKKTFSTACSHANGAIIGSAYIRALDENHDIAAATRDFLQPVLN